jgi:hypothetical protein
MKLVAALLLLLAVAACKKSEPPPPPRVDAPSKSDAAKKADAEAAANAAALKAVGLSEEDLRANAPERERIERDHAELYRGLAAKVGGDMSRCVIQAREEAPFPGTESKGKMMTLTANCPDNVPQSVIGR